MLSNHSVDKHGTVSLVSVYLELSRVYADIDVLVGLAAVLQVVKGLDLVQGVQQAPAEEADPQHAGWVHAELEAVHLSVQVGGRHWRSRGKFHHHFLNNLLIMHDGTGIIFSSTAFLIWRDLVYTQVGLQIIPIIIKIIKKTIMSQIADSANEVNFCQQCVSNDVNSLAQRQKKHFLQPDGT